MSVPRGSEPQPAGPRLVAWLEARLNLTEIFSFLTHFGFVYTPVDTTRPLRQVLAEVGRQPVPAYARWPRVLGLLAAILFALEAATGVLLAYYYRPTPEAAFASTRTIVRDLPFGWFLHQVHAWGAGLLVGVVALRLVRLFWDGLWRAPREILWWSAVAMTWLVLQADFTGRLLVWDAESYWSVVRGLEIVWALPVVGQVLAFLLGGRVVNDDVLIRFYVLHMVVLPLFFCLFLYLTFATLRRVGLSGEPSVARTEPASSFRHHLFDMANLALLAFALLVTLAVLLPFRFHAPADPYATPGGILPPWYMQAAYALLHRTPLPAWAAGLGLLAASFAVLLLPLWARGDDEATRRRVRVGGVAVLVIWLALTVMGVALDRG